MDRRRDPTIAGSRWIEEEIPLLRDRRKKENAEICHMIMSAATMYDRGHTTFFEFVSGGNNHENLSCP